MDGKCNLYTECSLTKASNSQGFQAGDKVHVESAGNVYDGTIVLQHANNPDKYDVQTSTGTFTKTAAQLTAVAEAPTLGSLPATALPSPRHPRSVARKAGETKL